jgi:hypothetical protein
VTWAWRKLHNKELCKLYSSLSINKHSDQVKEDVMDMACSTNGERRRMRVVGKPEGKRPLGRPRCRWVDNIKMALGEIGWWGKLTGFVWLRIGASRKLL